LADVELRLGDTWERTGPRTLTGEIELTQRQPGTTADVHEVESNVIFTVSTEAASTGRLAVSDDRPAARGPIAITASRCDPHAREPARVDIVAEGGARRALEDLLTSCLG
jgi:hypothetical protein